MALFSYEALAKNGKKVKGTLDASSLSIVREQLVQQGLYPIAIEQVIREKSSSILSRLFTRSMSTKDKISFTKQLATLIRSSVPLLQALELLTDQFKGSARAMLVEIKDEVKGGMAFADALGRYPKTFDNIYVQLVRAGEATGRLDVVLDRLREHLERNETIKRRIRSAIQQPVIQLIVALVVIGIMVAFVIPQIAEVLSGQGKKLPWATQLLMDTSYILTTYYLLIIPILGAFVSGFLWWKSTERGARQFDAIILRLPLIGYIARTSAVVQFGYTLGLLLENGVNLAQALDIVCNIIDNRVLAHKLKEARDNIIKQGKISEYLQQTKIFPPVAIYLIQTGEQTGQLDAMLLTVARNFDVELTELIDKLTGYLGPAMLIMMAGIVGFIIYAIAGPIMQLTQQSF